MSNDISGILLELRPIQDKIIKSGTENILDRWEFGKLLVAERGDKKQLPNGMRADIADTFVLEASEITRRMQLADKFKTQTEVEAACTRCGGSWRRIIREELIKRRKDGSPDVNQWVDRVKARLDKMLTEAGESDDRADELVNLLVLSLRTLGYDFKVES